MRNRNEQRKTGRNKKNESVPSRDRNRDNLNKVRGTLKKNKAVYTTAPVAGGWAGAVMSWAGAVISQAGALTLMKYSYRIVPNLSPGASFKLKFNFVSLPPNQRPPLCNIWQILVV